MEHLDDYPGILTFNLFNIYIMRNNSIEDKIDRAYSIMRGGGLALLSVGSVIGVSLVVYSTMQQYTEIKSLRFLVTLIMVIAELAGIELALKTSSSRLASHFGVFEKSEYRVLAHFLVAGIVTIAISFSANKFTSDIIVDREKGLSYDDAKKSKVDSLNTLLVLNYQREVSSYSKKNKSHITQQEKENKAKLNVLMSGVSESWINDAKSGSTYYKKFSKSSKYRQFIEKYNELSKAEFSSLPYPTKPVEIKYSNSSKYELLQERYGNVKGILTYIVLASFLLVAITTGIQRDHREKYGIISTDNPVAEFDIIVTAFRFCYAIVAVVTYNVIKVARLDRIGFAPIPESWELHNIKANKRNSSATQTKRICRNCGDEISKNRGGAYCSDSCRTIYNRKIKK